MVQKKQTTYMGVVHPWLCDNMGHMTTRHYVAMFDDGSYHFLHSVGSAMSQDQSNGLGWADVHQEIEYLDEMNAGDLAMIKAWPVVLGTKSISYTQELHNAVTNKLCARVTTKTVRFDLKARKAIVVEDSLREAISARL